MNTSKLCAADAADDAPPQGSRAAELWQLRAAGCSRCMCVLEVDPVNTSKLCAATWSVHAGNPGLRFSGSPEGEAIIVRAAGETPPSCRDAAVAADTRPPRGALVPQEGLPRGLLDSGTYVQ